ncbi:MAG: hypothetical protein J6D20_04340 [Clostridia bacterium]|nr:hypothetical protein [Clostridia bacterium]
MKKFLSLLTLTAILIFAFVSCKNVGDGDSSDDTPVGLKPIFSHGSTVTIVSSSSELNAEYADLYSTKVNDIAATLKYSDAMPTVNLAIDGDIATVNEIVVGPTSRDISAKALKALNRVTLSDMQESELLLGYSRYCIYSEGGSIAINYDADKYGAAITYVTEKLIDDYLFGKSELTLPDGIVEIGYVDIYNYLNEEDGKEVELQWSTLKSYLGDDATGALRNLYEIYKNEMIDWMANLWEPYTCACETEKCTNSSMYCGGAAFYYSNSGRNTVGYLPDSESTRQILAFMESSGMTGNYATALPDDMKAGIIRFLKSLQDPESGYFYHPQWGDGISDSRRGRDLRDCTGMLKRLGSAPTYDAPDGTKGDGILADGTAIEATAPASYLTGKLKTNTAHAVSKIVPAAAAIPEHLVDKDSFETYLDSLNIRTNSYAAGNDLSAQFSEIKQRDEVLKSEGKDYSLVSILVKFLNDNQNPDTGTWDWPMENDQRGVYHANNGVLKIVHIYNNTGTVIPNYTKIITNAVDTLLNEENPGAVVDVYNVWYTLSMVKSNIETNGGTEAKTHLEAFRAELLKKAVTLIDATREKLVLFLKPDGSFSYHPQYSSSVSQSAPVAVPQSEEGDVNATTICCTGTLSTMFSTFGLSNYMPAVYTNVDYLRFMHIIGELGPVIKDEVPAFEVVTSNTENKGQGEYYDDALKFDNKLFSELVHDGIFYSQNDLISWDILNRGIFAANAYVDGDKVMAYGKKIGGSPYMYINLMNGKNGNAFVFETDICFVGGSTNYSDLGMLQFWFDDANINDLNMWWNSSFQVNMEQSTVDKEGEPLGRHSFAPTMKKHVFTNGTWHNIRLEVQNAALLGSEIRFYVDNTLINRKYVTTANAGIDHLTMRFRGDSGFDSLVLFDNMFFGSFDKIDTDDTVLIPDNIVIGDAFDKIGNSNINGSGVNYDKAETYSNTNLAALSLLGKIGSQENKLTLDTINAAYYAAIRRVSGNEALVFGKTTTSDPYMFLYAVGNEDEDDKSLVFETDFAIAAGTAPGRSDNVVMQWFASQSKDVSYWYNIDPYITLIDGKYYLNGRGGLKEEIDASAWYNLRIEVDDTSVVGSEVRIYVNGELKSTFNTTSSAPYVESMMVRFMSQCTDGRVYFDNTYMRAPTAPTSTGGDGDQTDPPAGGDTPTPPVIDTSSDYYGKGVYVNDKNTISYDGKTFAGITGITHVGSGIEASVANIGGKEAAKFFVDWANHAYDRYSITRNGTATNLVFETDFMLPEYSSSAVFEIMPTSNISGNAGIWGNQIYFRYDSASGKNYVCIRNAETADGWFVLPEGVWVNIRVEYDGINPGDTFRLIANGVLVAESALNKSLADTKGLQIQFPGAYVGTVYFDNTYLGDKDPSVAPPTSGGTDEPIAPPTGGGDENEPSVDTSADYYGKGEYASDENTITYDGKILTDIADITHVGNGINASVVTVGDKEAVKFTADASGHAYDRYSVARHGTSDSFVFETDVMIPEYNSNLDFYIMPTSNLAAAASVYRGYIHFKYDATNGKNYVTLMTASGGVTSTDSKDWFFVPEGKWFNLRVEYDGTAGGSTFRLIVNGVLVQEAVLHNSMAGFTGFQIQFPGTCVGTIYFDNTYLGDKKSQDLTAEN